ncbi:MAG: AAA family ATPase [Sedimentisphaerales bacterium]|nr:AAA family ATPase [Sedimentisphaerales bacterium]
MRTIAIVNQKGGCGKTTVSINLASALAEAGQKVLLVDMDSQSHCAVGLAVPEQQIEQSIYDVLISRSRNEPIKLTEILWQISDKLELAPASIDLSAFEQQMAGIPDRERCLKDAIEGVKNDYDFVLIDCPPAVGLLTFNALRAASDVIVPVETGYFALHGLSKQLETLSILCKRCSQHVEVRVLASMYDIRTKMAREILAELREHFSDKMFTTIVNFNTKIKEAASFGQPISEYDPASKGQKDFQALAEEVIGLSAKEQRHEFVNSLADQLESISATADELIRAANPPINIVETTPHERSAPEEFVTADAQPAPKQAEAPVPVQQAAQPSQPPIHQEPRHGEIPDLTPAKSEPTDLNAKLADYYGVNQMSDAVVFVTLYPRAQSVQIASDFNNWQPVETPMQKVGTSGVWQTKIKLPRGKYRYRLVVDGQWQQDPYNERTEVNPFGEYNSILEVK